MGGNALADGLTERKPVEQYLEIKSIVLNRISDALDEERRLTSCTTLDTISEIVEMPEKTSFGDLDLLFVCSPGKTREDVIALIVQLFSPTEFAVGNIISFDFMKFQIDMIECTHENYSMTKFCLSFGDRGMILGQMAKSRGFSLGPSGLTISHCDIQDMLEIKTHLNAKDKITLTRDHLEVREFMGLPASDEGLHSEAAVEGFCLQSPWFRPQDFAPRQLGSCDSRKKLNKRPFYRKFCAKITADYNLGELAPRSPSEQLEELQSRRAHIEEAIQRFNKQGDVEKIRLQNAIESEVKEKLNYKLFISLGIVDRNIGKARASFCEWLVTRDMDAPRGRKVEADQEAALQQIVLKKNVDEINADLHKWYEEVWNKK